VRLTPIRTTYELLRFGKMDLRFAAITLQNNSVLVTRNLRDFQRIPNLVVEDWAV
jgi:tRNA(fMet)-specific endonuclease VapC